MRPFLRRGGAPSAIVPTGNVFVPLFLILTLVALVNSLQTYYLFFRGDHTAANAFRIVLSKAIYCWFYAGLALLIHRLSTRVRLDRPRALRWVFVHLLTLTGCVVLHQTISYGADTLIWGAAPGETLLDLFINNLSAWIDVVVYVLFLLAFHLIEYKRINQENEIQCTRLEEQLIRSKLRELRSKINPQFLFHTLRAISDLLRQKRHRDANQILTLLSDFLRTTVYNNEWEEIRFEEELRFLNQYLEIEKVRSNYRIRVTEEIETGVLDAAVPNYFLQPLLQDVLTRRGGEGGGRCEIVLHAGKEGTNLAVTLEHKSPGEVIDSGAHTVEGEAVPMIRERLAQLYGSAQQLTVEEGHAGGFLVLVRIPFHLTSREQAAQLMEEPV